MEGNNQEEGKTCCCCSAEARQEQETSQNLEQTRCCQESEQGHHQEERCCNKQGQTCCKEKLKEMEEQIAEITNKYIRLYAEFENYKKRTNKEKAHYHQKSQEQIFKEILPIIDDFERSLEASKTKECIANSALEQGIELIYNKCKKVLKDFEIEAIEIQIGERFNEETSEAIMQKPIEQGEEAGKVVQILEKGYKQKGRVIRHAKVVIGK